MSATLLVELLTEELPPKALQRVGKFDVHTQVIGIQLQLIPFEQRRVLVDVHRQRADIALVFSRGDVTRRLQHPRGCGPAPTGHLSPLLPLTAPCTSSS